MFGELCVDQSPKFVVSLCNDLGINWNVEKREEDKKTVLME